MSNINDSSITLNDANLELLCKDCHYEEHADDRRKAFSKRRYVIDEKTGAVYVRDTLPSK